MIQTSVGCQSDTRRARNTVADCVDTNDITSTNQQVRTAAGVLQRRPVRSVQTETRVASSGPQRIQNHHDSILLFLPYREDQWREKVWKCEYQQRRRCYLRISASDYIFYATEKKKYMI